MKPLVSINALSVQFDTPEGCIAAVRDVSLQLGAGESLAVVGESGAGKSQLFHAVMGLLPRHACCQGSVQFDGTELLHQPPALLNRYRGRRMAMVFQDPMTALNPLLTVGRQMSEVLEVHHRMSQTQARAATIDMLKQVRIPDAARRFTCYPHELSGGMRQRVMLGMALLCEPQLLIADEPTTALDVTVQSEILALLQEMCTRQHMAVVLITHDLPLAGGLCQRIAVMRQGEIIEQGVTEALFRQPNHPYTRQLLAAARLKIPVR